MIKKLAWLLGSLISYVYALNCSSVTDIKKYNGHYYTITAHKLTFLEAKQFAEANGGYLAIPNSAEENNFLKSLIPTPKYAWIGVYDPSYMSNYCYEGGSCLYDDSRFVDIKGNALIYTNWANNQPDNLVKSYDILNGKQLVSPLGEHWVAMSSIDGKWGDFGNHADEYNNPVKFYALIEFESMPECYTPPSDVTDEFGETPKCNTQIYDNTTEVVSPGQTYDCLQDPNGEYYCPVALAPCGEEWDYTDSYVVEHTGVVRDYADKIIETSYVYSTPEITYNLNSSLGGTITNNNQKILIGYRDEYATVKYYLKMNTNGDLYSIIETPFFTWSRLVDDTGILISTVAYRSPYNSYTTYYNVYLKKIGNDYYIRSYYITNAGVFISGYVKLQNNVLVNRYYTAFGVISHYLSLGEANYICPDDYTLTQDGECYKTQTVAVCPTGYTDNGSNCYKDISYTYYQYLCESDPNEYGEDYEPIDPGLTTCTKTDPDTSSINDTTLDDSCNSSTPPPNNCKRENFVCKEAPDRKCVYVDNKWQCSPFPCIGEGAGDYNITTDDTPVGINDANNNGWNSDGTCSGQLYIFNGKDMRCRSDDAFFELTGGGCCDKDKVFLGLVECKEDEKILARKNDNGMCHYIGEYCSKKLDLKVKTICVQHKKTYCCFNSKLARIINEQGRPQLSKDWGSADSPNCRGFTPEEFQKLDFSKMDLSEFYNDLSQSVSSSVLTNMTNYIQNSIENQLSTVTTP